MRRRGKRRHLTRLQWSLLVIVVGLVLLAVAAATYKPSVIKPLAAKYFEISDAAGFPRPTTKDPIVISLGFKITPISGDAHDVFITVDGLTDSNDPDLGGVTFDTIKMGEVKSVYLVGISGVGGYPAEQDGTGRFRVEIHVSSAETVIDPDKDSIWAYLS